MNPYEILELDENCTDEEIKIAYRTIAKIHHPDIVGENEFFVSVILAVSILRDPFKRKMFDETGYTGEIEKDQLEKIVLGKFIDLLNGWIEEQISSENETNINKYFDNVLKKVTTEIHKKQDTINKRISLLEKRVKTIKVKKGLPNIATKHIQEMIESLKKSKNELIKEEIVVTHVKDLCENYSSEEITRKFDNDRAHFSGGFFNFTTA